MPEWTDELVAKMKDFVAQGFSAGAIADEMKGFTRNAIIGKAHRLGMSLGGEKRQERAKERSDAIQKVSAIPKERRKDAKRRFNPFLGLAKKAAPPPELPAAEEEPEPQVAEAVPEFEVGTGVDFLERRMGQCAWPLWANHERTGQCCGKATTTFDKPYCRQHATIAFQPQRPSTRPAKPFQVRESK